MTGRVVGSIVLTASTGMAELGGVRLEQWFRQNGAEVSVENEKRRSPGREERF
ncbi:hypothetical protein [Actinomadura formosensis]|uniref:hypothetical protein n=1 Tax=Actinomadura formosensis TaxID=60706 RepID=UPI0012F87E75|nr:hypothetical protein [Actinomadura formosensis]